MKWLRRLLICTAFVALLSGGHAFARSVTATYEDDAYRDKYVAVSEVIFSNYPEYECGVSKVDWSEKKLQKFRNRNFIAPTKEIENRTMRN